MRQELIQFFCAPFEAEWQCVSLVMYGVADCILSTDGDCVVLGAPKVVVQLTISTKQCYIYDRSTVMSSLLVEQYNITVNEDFLPEIAAFLGCDYIKRLHGNDPDKVFNTILPGY
jgi:5'-3' exonuclease